MLSLYPRNVIEDVDELQPVEIDDHLHSELDMIQPSSFLLLCSHSPAGCERWNGPCRSSEICFG